MTEKLDQDQANKVKAPKEKLGKLPKGASMSEKEFIESLEGLSAAELLRRLQGKAGKDESAEFRNGGQVSLGKFKGSF